MKRSILTVVFGGLIALSAPLAASAGQGGVYEVNQRDALKRQGDTIRAENVAAATSKGSAAQLPKARARANPRR